VVKLLKRPENIDRLTALGADPVGSSPTEFRAKLERELQTFAKLIPTLGIKPQ
jgi:tripartite-type tricarboxylate transporter receptor subunit TctC